MCQLDNIGISAGHLPDKPPFSNAYQGPAAKTQSTAKISNREVQSAINDSDFFYDLYVRTTKSAIDMYAKAGRRKFALKLHGSLAALDVSVYFPVLDARPRSWTLVGIDNASAQR